MFDQALGTIGRDRAKLLLRPPAWDRWSAWESPLRLDGHRHCVGYLNGMLHDGRERVPAGLEEATRSRCTVIVYDPDLVDLTLRGGAGH